LAMKTISNYSQDMKCQALEITYTSGADRVPVKPFHSQSLPLANADLVTLAN
jgi:hypothetical protein